MIGFDFYDLMRPLWELQQRSREMLMSTAVGGDSLVDRVGADATLMLSDAASENSPFLTGTLSSAHRGVWNDFGQVFIDKDVVNPLFGGRPSVYGIEVHGRKPWMEQTVKEDAPDIINYAMSELAAGWDKIWS